ncbi:Transposase IS200 like [Nitrosomonas communis]|uniref:Transposase IS200 like n=2 Tax=Nitrosomonas communis TaxID=44574 RepID=A0A1H2Z8S7_9PROT|nr:Transposase IS200 like [Nitrosomonas communis]
MDNHYHLLVETNSPTLSKGMKYLNGTYTQYFNRQHRRVGHGVSRSFQSHPGAESCLSAGIGALH